MTNYYDSLIEEGYKVYKKEIIFNDVHYMVWLAINESIDYYKFYLFNLEDYYNKQIESLYYRDIEEKKLLGVKDYLSNVTKDKITYSDLLKIITRWITEYDKKLKEIEEEKLVDKQFEEWDGVIKNGCEWISYDYRTMCPKNHGDVNNPYWKIPDNMENLKYCPYCGKRIIFDKER